MAVSFGCERPQLNYNGLSDNGPKLTAGQYYRSAPLYHVPPQTGHFPRRTGLMVSSNPLSFDLLPSDRGTNLSFQPLRSSNRAPGIDSWCRRMVICRP